MKRWAFVTVGLYALMLLAMSGPSLWLGGAKWSAASGMKWEWGLHETREMFGQWGYWLWLGIMLAAQALLLLVPVRLAERRPKPRRHLWAPLVTASFFLALLFLAGCCALLAALLGDDMAKPFMWLGEMATKVESQLPGLQAVSSTLGLDGDFFFTASFFGTLLALWLIWGLLFYRCASADEPGARIRRAVRWLMRGSILELLVAVPCHVAVRCRNTCCAQAATFWGIVTGLSVMLMAFGPGIFFLFAERADRLRPRTEPAEPPIIG
jgi:hypothetical protein